MNRASETKLRAMASGVGLAVFGSAVLVEKLSKRSEGTSRVRMTWNAVAGFAAGWIGDHEMMTAADTELKTSGHTGDPVALTGHSPVYTVLSPDFKPLQQAKFVLPADPRGTCSTWPMSWAPAGQFPGAFVP